MYLTAGIKYMVGLFTGILSLSFYPKTCGFGLVFGSCVDMGHVSNSRMSLHGFNSLQ